jgi:DNA primase
MAQARPEAARARRIIVVEGYTDVLALHQAGMPNAVAIMGTSLTEEQVTELAKLLGAGSRTAGEEANPAVELALDADASGQEAMIRADRVAQARRLTLRVVPMPEGTDPAELVQREGAEVMRRLVEASEPFAEFRTDRILSSANLDRLEGREDALTQLHRVLGALPPGPQRDELTRRAASRLGLSEKVVAERLAGPPPPEPPARPARPGPAGTGADDRHAGEGVAAGPGAAPTYGRRAPLDRRQEAERAFLALCLAFPEDGARALSRIDIDRHLTGELERRAARHLAGRLSTPLEGLPPEDEELARVVAELVVRAGDDRADPSVLEAQVWQLELARLDRAIAAARASGGGEVATLAAERIAAKQHFDAAYESADEARSAGR